MSIEYRALGPLQVVRDGEVLNLGAYRQRALFALLLANAGTVLSTDRILDELWDGAGGTDKQSSLWVYISGLRAALEPDRAKRSEGTILLTRAPGYVLAIDPQHTDVGRFERAILDARAAAEVDPAGASSALRAGLALWRGHAYEEFIYESWAQNEIARLEELRVEATESRIEADLAVGLARELLSELHSLVRQHPLRERFVMALMLALYRSGRAPEALRAASAFRQRLVSEVGVEPSRALRDLEHDILVDDGHLLIDGASRSAPLRPRSGLTVRGYELREEIGRGSFGSVFRAYQPIVGREVAIKVIRPELADDPSFIRRFESEAQVVASLEHPHIVPLYDFWREPGAAYLVMRLVRTGSLADAVSIGALPVDRAAAVFTQLAGALRSAHRHGIVHRDVKPENILIDEDGNAYLTDFGVATAGDDTGTSSLPAPYVSPEQVRGLAEPASDVYSLAVVAAIALTGLGGEYEQVRGALTPAVRAVLDRATASDPARRYTDVTTFAMALTDALGVPESTLVDDAPIENPYKGLRAFGPADAGEFFGRERLVERLLARLGGPGVRGRFVAVVGPSGSGKSSAVRAGLLPALARGALPMSQEWFRIELSPGPHPFEELEAALVSVASVPPTALLDVLLVPGGLRRAVQRVLPSDDSQLLIVIDQFEELFTQVDEDTAARFIDELVDLVSGSGTHARVVITLRADFYDRPLRHRRLGELLRDGTEVITPMSIDELQAAITGPAAKVGVTIDPLVVSAMVSETVDRNGALPLLQYTLTDLFEAHAGRAITLAAYEAGGGVSRMLARRADSLLAGLGEELTETARHVLLRLVTVDDDSVSARRRALVAEIEELDDSGRVRRFLETFGRHRMLTFDRDPVTRGPTVEISHEALLTEWATLRAWIDDAREDLRMHRHLAHELTAWTAAGRSDDFLLRGGRLDAFAAWAETSGLVLRPAERVFLDASVELRASEQRERAVEEQRVTVAEHRVRRRTLQLAAAGVAIALVAGLATFAWFQRDDARRAQADLRANQAAQRVASSSLSALATDAELALLLAEQAVAETEELGYAVPEAIDATQWALQELGVQFPVTSETPTAGRFGPDGVRGVWVLSIAELMAIADEVTDRQLTVDECERFVGRSDCSRPTDVAEIEYLGGTEAYAGVVPLDRAEIVIAIGTQGASQEAEWRANLDAIAEQYDLNVRIQQVPLSLPALEAAYQNSPADVYTMVGGGQLQEFAASRPLLDLRSFIDEDQLIEDYGTHLVSLSRIGDDGSWPSETGPVHGVFVGANSKAVVWTNEPEFSELGYQAPSDWESFIGLADSIVGDDRTPLCLEFGGDGWPVTDWVEQVVLRTGGPDFYESWLRHEVPFDHPIVVDAIGTIGEMVHGEGYLDLSPSATTARGFTDALFALVDQPATCLMTPFPSFLPAMVGAEGDLPVGSFEFPAFGAGFDEAVVGGGDIAVAVTDRPEVRTLMAALASPDWGVGAAQLQWPQMLPPNARFDVSAMANPEIAEIVAALHDAIRADELRFDGSDRLPTGVGSSFSDGLSRLFREGSVDNVDALAQEIAADVETVWRQLDAND